MKNEWDLRLNYLDAVRDGWCNTDYMEFLVQRVWRIERAVDIVDFGCGYGYLGLLLMPLMPRNSTYTGIDQSEVLLSEAKKRLCNTPYDTQFICADLRDYSPREEYNIAISNAVLRHIPHPQSVLKKMIRSVKPGGWVICMETDRVMEDAGRYFSNIEYDALEQTGLYKKIWQYEYAQGGRDYRTGMKMPHMMQELGLRDIQVRINDCVKFANPHDAAYEHIYQSMMEENGWNKEYDKDEIRRFVDIMMEKGLTRKEAERFVSNEMSIQRSVQTGHGKEYILKMACTPIISGRKPGSEAAKGCNGRHDKSNNVEI